jgi:hypothetical protein
MNDNDLIEIEGEIITDTDYAILLFDGSLEGWVPKSLIEVDPEFYEFEKLVTVSMPIWLARDKGFI